MADTTGIAPVFTQTCGMFGRPSLVAACLVHDGLRSTDPAVRAQAQRIGEVSRSWQGRAALFIGDVWFVVRRHWPWFVGGVAVLGLGVWAYRRRRSLSGLPRRRGLGGPLLSRAKNLMGEPLAPGVRKGILDYIDRPSLEQWRRVRQVVISPSMRHGTLWQAVIAIDRTFPLDESERYPDALAVARAIRTATGRG